MLLAKKSPQILAVHLVSIHWTLQIKLTGKEETHSPQFGFHRTSSGTKILTDVNILLKSEAQVVTC